MHESWYRNDDIDLTAATKNLTLTEEGMYKVKIQNMDEIDFVTAFITGFNNCTNNKKYMNSSEFAEIHYSAERTINDLFLNLGKVVTEEGMVDKKKASKSPNFDFFSDQEHPLQAALRDSRRDPGYYHHRLVAGFLPDLTLREKARCLNLSTRCYPPWLFRLIIKNNKFQNFTQNTTAFSQIKYSIKIFNFCN